MLAIETNADPNSNIILYTLLRILIIRFEFVILSLGTVCFALDNQTPAACRDELLENGGKFTRHLLKGSLNGLILPLVQHLDQIIN